MFNSIIPNIIQPKSVKFNSPQFLTLKFDEEEDMIVSLEKGASNYIYKALDLKESTSKEIHKKSEELWKELINLCEENSRDGKYNFYLDKSTNLFFVTESGELIDVFDCQLDENIEVIKDRYERFKLDLTERTKTCKMYTEGKNDLIKMIIYSSNYDVNDDYTPIILLELNSKKSQYNVYTGILLFSSYVLIPNYSIFNSYKQFAEFINDFSIDYVLDYATEHAENLYQDYLQMKNNPVEISARELLTLLDKVGYKLSLNNDNDIDKIDAIEGEESSSKIQKFFNTFKFTTGETATDILNLSEFKKIFKYNNLTFLDVLEILSNEYVRYEGAKITADILSGVMYTLYNRSDDKEQVTSIKKEI